MGARILTVWRRRCGISAVHRVVALLTVLVAVVSGARADRDACLQAHEQGQVSRLQHRPADARARFKSCMQPECPRLIRDDCASLLAALDASRVHVTFSARDASGQSLAAVRVIVDDAPITEAPDGRHVLALDPGEHTVRFEATGHIAHDQRLVLQEGEGAREVAVQLERASVADATTRSRRLRWTTLALGGAAIATAVTGVGLAVSGKREHDHLDEVCGVERDCGSAQTEKGRALYVAADVCFGIAGALAVSAATLFLVDHYRRQPDRASARITGRVSRAGAGFAITGEF